MLINSTYVEGSWNMKVRRLIVAIFFGVANFTALGSVAADGTAKATVTTADGTFSYSGGSCIKNAGGLVINIGTPPSQAAPGTHADYFGASIEKVPGHFENAVVTFNKNGKRYAIGSASGEATANGASFSGSVMRGGGKATGSFSC
jgi:hypothetical protein